ncbi:MAG: hypothetical protein ACTS5F_00270 [Candidatus Hodgkinia cicadicola]
MKNRLEAALNDNLVNMFEMLLYVLGGQNVKLKRSWRPPKDYKSKLTFVCSVSVKLNEMNVSLLVRNGGRLVGTDTELIRSML